MPTHGSSDTPQDLAQIAAELMARVVGPSLCSEDDGKFVAIDLGSGEYEIDADDYAAVSRLRARLPTANVWLARAGSPATCRLGVCS